jgi:mannose-6-phosphate isomerase
MVERVKFRGVVKDYQWGKPAAGSLIRPLLEGPCPYDRLAELWFGDHIRGPGETLDRSTNLHDLISGNPGAFLGRRLQELGYTNLPYLFKVLSIDGTFGLSLQVHPTREMAKRMRALPNSDLADDGEKAEMGVALNDVRLLCGFRPESEVERLLPALPRQYRAYLEGKAPVIRFASLLALKPAECGALADELFAEGVLSALPDSLAEVMVRLRTRYGVRDRGLLIVPLLNLVTLRRGEAIFISPGVLHAYLEGDLVECMVNSDNVLRAGLTNKHVDVDGVMAATDWSAEPARSQVVTGPTPQMNGFVRRKVPCKHFVLDMADDFSGTAPIPASEHPQLVIVLSGECDLSESQLKAGEAVLLPPGTTPGSLIGRGASVCLVSCAL